MAEPIVNVLGVVGMKTRGEYNPETTYEKLNVVTYNGSSYCAKTDTQGNLPTNTLYWDLIAEKGEKGDAPTKGVDYWTASDKAEVETDLASDVTSEVTDQLSDLTSATPLAASSIAGMTDTTRIYVNTADGHWYWHNGSEWIDGGVYQATEIVEHSIYPEHTIFYEDINLIPKLNWTQGKIIGNSGTITDYSSGCYNEEYVSVTGGDKLVIINNSNVNFNYMKIREYASDKSFIAANDLLNINYYTLNANTAYVRFTSWNNNFATLPDNCYLVLSSNTFDKLNNYNIYNKLNEKYKDSELAKDVLLENENRFYSKPYTYGLSFNVNDITFNNIRDAQYTATITNSTVYTGLYMKLPNIKLHDVLYIDFTGSSNLPNNGVVLARSGDVAVATCKQIDDYHYKVEVDSNIITYKNDLRIMLKFSGLTINNTLTINTKLSVNNHSNTLKEYIEHNTPVKKFILLGDSITHATGTNNWFLQMQNKINASLIANVAVDGAHLKDYSDTGAYDGNPTNGSHNNVLGNQVQKIINNDYDDPDFIMIAIGTNDGISATDEQIYNTYYDANQTLIPVENVDRKTAAGAFRWCNEKLHDKYPNAKIIWCTPIQGTARSTQAIINWGDALKRLCAWGSNYCIDTEKCGISITNASEYLADGLHPNRAGAILMGEYNAAEISKFMDK